MIIIFPCSTESSIGKAIKDSGLKREDIFQVSKLWMDVRGRDAAAVAVKESLKR